MHFKSFGGTVNIPLEEGFTVVTGPNGSGKSNILDGVLFCLGLATSRGMRADRLPDLVNSGKLKQGKSAETEVKVTFDLTDWEPDPAELDLEPSEEGPWIKTTQKEWTVSRRLKVMPGGSYSSTYFSDGEICNLQQLQTQLRRLRIDPEGSNVVMQGDVTRIVSMSNRDRRVLIDELAGVALFDNRIDQTKSKLDAVQERQERCRIVEQELVINRQKLERDCAKARRYQELRNDLQIGKKQELVLSFEFSKEGIIKLNQKKELLIKNHEDTKLSIDEKKAILNIDCEELAKLQSKVKELGEDKLLAVQSELAGLQTQNLELDRQANFHKEEGEKLQKERRDLLDRRNLINDQDHQNKQKYDSDQLTIAHKKCSDAEASVEASKRRLREVAGRSGEWLDLQRDRAKSRDAIQLKLQPLKNAQEEIEDKLLQISVIENELKSDQERDDIQNNDVINLIKKIDIEFQNNLEKIQSCKNLISENIDKLSIQMRTKRRLENEQLKLEKDITRIESRKEAIHETRGTGALRILLEQGLEGIHGPVAQLGEVKDKYKLALEVAAGSRLGHIVVDNDEIAARCIEFLKKQRVGRLTFLPLNRLAKTNTINSAAMQKGVFKSRSNGLIGKAVDLVEFQQVYLPVFSYVFGDTYVYSDLDSARQEFSKNRIVTLDGELLEKSGAMTGGILSRKGIGLSFGTSKERDELEPLRKRLIEIGDTLMLCIKEESRITEIINQNKLDLNSLEKRYSALEAQKITSEKSNQPCLSRRESRFSRIKQLLDSRAESDLKLKELNKQILPLNNELSKLAADEKHISDNKDASNWRNLQADLDASDEKLNIARQQLDEKLNAKREHELLRDRIIDQLKSIENEEKKLQVSIENLSNAHLQWRENNRKLRERRNVLEETQKDLQDLFGEQRRARDKAEALVAENRLELQEKEWSLERIKDDLKSIDEETRNAKVKLEELEKGLPDPLPQIPDEVRENGLDALQSSLKILQEKMEALEPVNMLALEELEKLEERLGELENRLEILSQERSELLLRIETVATLRQEAFMEAFQAVDKHFREIFASLSEGDGHLQLDNQEDPLEGGLTLVAHPKGKPVRRLAAMSGGEKSLTALSFLFALQRFRPSPFYALDEVDSFLDGVNVERLSSLIAKQAEQAQFLVVSHRRPMIAASDRTIGVTQARGAHTQVVGLPDAA